jgi:hypothetical protein
MTAARAQITRQTEPAIRLGAHMTRLEEKTPSVLIERSRRPEAIAFISYRAVACIPISVRRHGKVASAGAAGIRRAGAGMYLLQRDGEIG